MLPVIVALSLSLSAAVCADLTSALLLWQVLKQQEQHLDSLAARGAASPEVAAALAQLRRCVEVRA